MAEQTTITGRVLAIFRIRGEWSVLGDVATGKATLRCDRSAHRAPEPW